MSAQGLSVNAGELERLVDRHIELCELFGEHRPSGPRALPMTLVTRTEGKTEADALSDLAARAFVAYEGRGLPQDSTILALKFAVTRAIEGILERESAVP